MFRHLCALRSSTAGAQSANAFTDHIDHVRTQLPYALLAGAAATAAFVVAGFLL